MTMAGMDRWLWLEMGSYREMAGTPKEFALREPVCQWLVDNQYWPELELRRAGYICDIFGAKFGPRPGPKRVPPIIDVMAVELKLEDMAGVLRQCKRHATYCERVYAAIPAARYQRLREATKHQFVNAGIGILTVDGVHVEVAISCFVRQIDMTDEGAVGCQQALKNAMWRRARRSYDASGFADLLATGD